MSQGKYYKKQCKFTSKKFKFLVLLFETSGANNGQYIEIRVPVPQKHVVWLTHLVSLAD
jgi:hypothetical protein